MSYDYDIILYDLDGARCPKDLDSPVGGSEVELYQLYDMFRNAGIKTALVATQGVPEYHGRCKRLIFWRQVKSVLSWCEPQSDAQYLRMTDADPDLGAGFHGTMVCVSGWQRRMLDGRARDYAVVPPMLGDHVYSSTNAAKPYYEELADSWIYASAANKGIEDTLASWKQKPAGNRLLVTTTGYDEPTSGLCESYGAEWIGKLSPKDMVRVMGMCRGMYYRNRAPETFGVTTAIAVALGLELDIECVGHEPCGLAESRVPQDLSEEATLERWMEVLDL